MGNTAIPLMKTIFAFYLFKGIRFSRSFVPRPITNSDRRYIIIDCMTSVIPNINIDFNFGSGVFPNRCIVIIKYANARVKQK